MQGNGGSELVAAPQVRVLDQLGQLAATPEAGRHPKAISTLGLSELGARDSRQVRSESAAASAISTVHLGPEGDLALRTDRFGREVVSERKSRQSRESSFGEHRDLSGEESPLLTLRVEFSDGLLIGPPA